jgi:DNA-binding LacI/PurR family transcriptional regulator
MARGRAHTLACLAPNLTDYTFASIIEGAEMEARQHGYFLLSSSAPDPDAFADLIEDVIAHGRADGLLVINPYVDGRFEHLPADAPVVLLGAHARQAGMASISLNDAHAAQTAMGHLLALGHQQIAMIQGPLAEDCVQDRNTGYQASLTQAGLEYNAALVFEGDWSATSGDLAAKELLRCGVPFTALFAQNDRMAVGAIRALREAGHRVPEDVSVVGVDDIPLASYFDPPLTTLRQDMTAIGRLAAQRLIAAIETPETSTEHINVSAELIVRGSTAPKPRI